jgi:hypothetical protein
MLLITRPRYDAATHYLFHWAGLLVAEAEKEKVKLVDLRIKKATKKNFDSYLSKQPIDTVILNGHGNADLVCGQDAEILVSINDNLSLLEGKDVFARACDAGASLGADIKKKGAASFIGYNQPFIFPIDKDSISQPLKDELAKPILECSNQVGLALIRGKSAEKAQEESLAKYKDKISECLSSKTPTTFMLPFLLWNMNAQVCYA